MLKPVIRILMIAVLSYSIASCGGGSGNSGLQTGESNSPAFFRLGSIVSPEESPEYSNVNSNGVAAMETSETPKPLERSDPIEVTFQYTTLSPTYIWADRDRGFPHQKQHELYPNITWSDFSSDVGVQTFKVSKSKSLDNLFGFDNHSSFKKQYGILTSQFDDGDSEIRLKYDGIYHPASDSLIFFVHKDFERYDPETSVRSDAVFSSLTGMTSGDSAYTMPKGTFNYEGVNMMMIAPCGCGPRQLLPVKSEHEGPFSMRVNFDEGTGSFESMVREVREGLRDTNILDSNPPTYFRELSGDHTKFSGKISVNTESGRFVGENIGIDRYTPIVGSSKLYVWNTSNVRLEGQFKGTDASSVIGAYKDVFLHGAIIGKRVD